MANPPNSGPPGNANSSTTFPQYGMQWNGTSWEVVTANSATDKANYQAQGVVLWFTSQAAAQSNINAQSGLFNGQVPGASWLSGLGGLIASGLEAGFVAFITDLWSGIVGYVEIGAGALLALVITIFIFRGQLMSVAPLALALAG
jgi:hypothetical protein